jgi:hypothetical protein
MESSFVAQLQDTLEVVYRKERPDIPGDSRHGVGAEVSGPEVTLEYEEDRLHVPTTVLQLGKMPVVIIAAMQQVGQEGLDFPAG